MSFIKNIYSENEYLPNLDFVSNEEVERLMEEENKRDAELIYNETESLLNIASDLNEIIKDSGEIILKTDEVMEESKENVDVACSNIFDANTYNLKSKQKKIILGSTIAGLCIGGPLGGILGAQTSVFLSTMCGISGLILGGGLFGAISTKITNYKIFKSKMKQ